jgi:heterodisulfide reductase subunit C
MTTSNDIIKLGAKKPSIFKDKVMALLPDNGNLNLCLTCGACSSGCPATGLLGMDPRKFLRMAALGMDDVLLSTEWVWMCTLCKRCVYVCPMKIDIPALVHHARGARQRENMPKNIVKSCDMAFTHDTCSSTGLSVKDWIDVVQSVEEEVREEQAGFESLQAPMDKQNAYFFLNQNSREPVADPDEMVPIWKILHLAGADWTYSSVGWAAENYCMFMNDTKNWERMVRFKSQAVENLGCKVWLNTE